MSHESSPEKKKRPRIRRPVNTAFAQLVGSSDAKAYGSKPTLRQAKSEGARKRVPNRISVEVRDMFRNASTTTRIAEDRRNARNSG